MVAPLLFDRSRSGTSVTVTESIELLSPVLLSENRKSGFTTAVFSNVPAEVGVTEKSVLNDAPSESVTSPLAVQLKAVPEIEQAIVPVGTVLPGVTVSTPCG